MIDNLAEGDVVALRCLRDEASGDLAGPLSRVGLADLRRWEGQAVLCLVADRLRTAGLTDSLPADVRTELATIESAYRQITELYSAESAELMVRFESAGMPVLLLKDPRGYAEPHLRPCYDMDLLVPPERLDEAGAVLAAAGYDERPGPLQRQLLSREASWSKDGDVRLSIDLHWHVLDSFRPRRPAVRLDRFFAESITVAVAGRQVPALSLEHHLILVCLHTFEHELRFPSRLVTWLDVSETVRRLGDQVDWDRLVGICREFDAGNEVYIALLVTADLLGAPVPDYVLRSVRPLYQSLGLERACFGYWNYPVKYLDDAARHGARTDGLPHALGALEKTTVVWTACDDLARRIVGSGGDAEVFGQPPEMLLPDPRLRTVGDIEICVSGISEGELADLVDATLGTTSAGELRRGVTVRLGPSRVRLGLDNEPRSAAAPRRDIRWLVRRLVLGGHASVDAVVRLVLLPEPADRLRYLTSRLEGLDAVELQAWAAIADLRREAGPGQLTIFPGASAREAAILSSAGIDAPRAIGVRWSFLRGLDNRSRGVEATTKFLVAPAGVRATSRLNVTGGGRWRALVREVVRRPGAVLADFRYLISQARGGDGERVPPRIYLTSAGGELTSLR